MERSVFRNSDTRGSGTTSHLGPSPSSLLPPVYGFRSPVAPGMDYEGQDLSTWNSVFGVSPTETNPGPPVLTVVFTLPSRVPPSSSFPLPCPAPDHRPS